MPSSPGIYIFEDKNHNPLYIGKSISLKDRIKQHLESAKNSFSKANYYVNQSSYLTYKTVKNDLQAVILEAHLIKTYRPKYNTITKDDKSLTYIVIDNLPHPKISTNHATDLIPKDYKNFNQQVFGPYLNQKTANNLIKQIRRLFGYCQNPFNPTQRACFNYHLHHCPGACLGIINQTEYQKHLNRISKFLSGKFSILEKDLLRKMKQFSLKQEYEEADKIKKQIDLLSSALESTQFQLFFEKHPKPQAVLQLLVDSLKHPQLSSIPQRIECYDAAHLQTDNYVAAMVVMTNGQIDKKQYRNFHIKSVDKSDQHVLRHVLERRFRHPEWPKPDLLVLDGGVSQLAIAKDSIPSSVAVIGLSKKHETIHFYNQGGQIVNINFSLDNPCLNLLQTLRDEAHRRANGFYRKTHRYSILK